MRRSASALALSLVLGLGLSLSACKALESGLEADLEYWSRQAAIFEALLGPDLPIDSDGYPCLRSNADATITLRVRNPQKYNFLLSNYGSQIVIDFPNTTTSSSSGGGKPQLEKDYFLTQPDPNNLTLTFTKAFLQHCEYGLSDLNPSITLYDNGTGRKFNECFSFRIRSNTPPPAIRDVRLAKTTGSQESYVLCFTVPDMAEKIGTDFLHKDIATLYIAKDQEAATGYALSVGSSDFTKPPDASFIKSTDIVKINPGDEDIPTGPWTLYYKTDVSVGAAATGYRLWLRDKKGLSAQSLAVTTDSNKAKSVKVELSSGNAGGDVNVETSQSAPVVIAGKSTTEPVQLSVSSETHGAIMHCTVTNLSDSTSSSFEGTPLTLSLSPNSDTSPRLYRLEAYASAPGYENSATRVFYYRVGPPSGVTPGLPDPANYILDTDPSTVTSTSGSSTTVTLVLKEKINGSYTVVTWDAARIKHAKITILQNGTATTYSATSTSANFPSLTIPATLPKGKYQLHLTVTIDGLYSAAIKDFTVN